MDHPMRKDFCERCGESNWSKDGANMLILFNDNYDYTTSCYKCQKILDARIGGTPLTHSMSVKERIAALRQVYLHWLGELFSCEDANIKLIKEMLREESCTNAG
jgi:hypothetical protein